jgi:hypothetical protein
VGWIMTEERFKELAESAISYLLDNDLLDDFLEDRDIELTNEECDCFGCEKGNYVYD